MPCTWRYLLRPDGSFCRIGNLDGRLDHLQDDEYGRLFHAPDTEQHPDRPCSRCGVELVLHWNGPLFTGVRMELCPVCDAHLPAAAAFIRWHRDPNRDPQALPYLFDSWELETMNAHGWSRPAQPEIPDSPPAPVILVPSKPR